MNRTIFSLLLLCLLISCNQKKNEMTEKETLENQIEQKNEIIISNLKEKYSIKYSLDTVRYKYTIQFEDMMRTKYQLIQRFGIQDIFVEDGISYINVLNVTTNRNLYLKLTIPETEKEKLLSQKASSSRFINAALVVSLNEFKKIDMIVKSNHDAIDYCTIELTDSEGFFGNGQVAEVQILNMYN